MRIIADHTRGRDNNLNLVRMVASLAVLVSHAYPISSGPNRLEPFKSSVGISLGTMAVYVFFAISGFLIAKSFEGSSSKRWTAARALRLFPGLAVVLLLTVSVLGPLATSLAPMKYATSPRAFSYLPRNLTLFSIQYDLPGVFVENPLGGVVNGSLWTLFYEVACYALLFAIGVVGLLRRRAWLAVALGVYAAGYTVVSMMGDDAPFRFQRFADLSLPFLIGVVFYVWRAEIPLMWTLGAIAGIGAFVLHDTALSHAAFVTALSYGTFLVAYLPGGLVRRYNGLGDYSYGVYVYAFPVQQVVAQFLGQHQPIVNIGIAVVPTLALAVASWYLVEERALAYVRRPVPLSLAAATPSRVE